MADANINDSMQDGLHKLYPSRDEHALKGLYLCSDLRQHIADNNTYVYSNFITSLDGRIAITPTVCDDLEIPKETANPRDWRLFLELATPADALIVSGRYVRQLADGSAQAPPPFESDTPEELRNFRDTNNLPIKPVLVILSQSLDLPVDMLADYEDRKIIVATSDQAVADRVHELENAGIVVKRLGNSRVDGKLLIKALKQEGLKLIFSMAGPLVMHTLLEARVVDRLYMTTVLRILSGAEFATITRGELLEPAYDFALSALYLDRHGPDGIEQLLQVYDKSTT
jgi:riboflavin biosynthesis pyrimidine reductase